MCYRDLICVVVAYLSDRLLKVPHTQLEYLCSVLQ